MILQVQKSRPLPDVCVLGLTGRLLMGNDSRQVEWAVSELLKEGVKKVVLDVTQLDVVDSTGIGIVVMCHARLQRQGGSLRIASSPGMVHETLHLTHVDKIVAFFCSAEEASKNFELN